MITACATLCKFSSDLANLGLLLPGSLQHFKSRIEVIDYKLAW